MEKLKERQTKGTVLIEEDTPENAVGDSYECVSVLLCDIVGKIKQTDKKNKQKTEKPKC